jgi:hypothetical protein
MPNNLYVVPFEQIMHEARVATGYNFPTMEQFAMYGMQNPYVEEMICIEAKRVCGKTDDALIADNDDAHYTLENVITQAVMALFRIHMRYTHP